ncbi:hypothetical protein EVJ58_g1939 [Rhodofomes roseus]|uniref:Uncharacterized protein n=1 Tax=Rhodofomes roseus TaxID=34475 RepID=A0A4Y9YUY0_9APHY|nr:hypothetical protein EVJ58_g1939 [Rhodofomes roseus]
MSESRSSASSSDPGRPGSRGRSHSQASNPSRRQQLRQSFQTPIYSGAPANAPPESSSASATPSPPFQSIAAPYQAAPLAAYGQRGPFVGQYTMSPQPPVSMPHYAYAPHHPGLHAPDTSMHSPQNPLMGYNPNTLVPMMQSPHNPVFQGYGQSHEGSSSSSHSHSFPGSPGSSALFSHSAHSHPQSPAHASPPSPLHPQGSGPHPQTIHPPHSAAYAGQSPYAPLRYPTPPFPYPPQSYAPSPSIYASHSYAPSHYPQHSYAPSPEASQEGQGTWWYVPPARPASGQYESFQNTYSMSFGVPHRDAEAYAQAPGSSSLPSPRYPVSPHQTHGSAPFSPAQALPPLAVPDPPAARAPGLPSRAVVATPKATGGGSLSSVKCALGDCTVSSWPAAPESARAAL